MAENKTTVELAISEDTKKLVDVLKQIVDEMRVVQEEVRKLRRTINDGPS